MAVLILGLVVFLGVHSIRIFAGDWRRRQVTRLGEGPWKGLYALTSPDRVCADYCGFRRRADNPGVTLCAAGLAAASQRRLHPDRVFLVAAAYVPRNHLKEKIGHPMLAGVKAWALGHLLSIGMLRDVVLFGAFLVWAIVDFVVSRRRDRASGTEYPAGTVGGDVVTVVVGVIAWALVAFWLHQLLIGMKSAGLRRARRRPTRPNRGITRKAVNGWYWPKGDWRGPEQAGPRSCRSSRPRPLTAPDPNSPINAALVLSDCRHWFSNVACCKQ